MKDYKILLVLLNAFFITTLLSSSVLAVQTQINLGVNGLDIGYPKIEYIKFNEQNLTLNFHVYNASNGFQLNNTVNCFIDLYDLNGNHIIDRKNIPRDSHDEDFELLIDQGNFSSTGTYNYITSCNSTEKLGGYVSSTLIVNYIGKEEPSGSALLFYWIGFIIILGGFVFTLFFSMGKIIDKKFDIIDLSVNLSLYFILVMFYILQLNNYGLPIMNSILVIFMWVGAFFHVLGSLIFFIMIWIWETMDKARTASGTIK